MLIALLVIVGLTNVTLMVTGFLLLRGAQKDVARLRAEVAEALQRTKPVQKIGDSRQMDEINSRMRDNDSHELTSKTLGDVGATLSAVLGKDVHISAVADGPAANESHHSWAQQGCVAIQNSHDLSKVKQAERAAVAVRRPPVSVRRVP